MHPPATRTTNTSRWAVSRLAGPCICQRGAWAATRTRRRWRACPYSAISITPTVGSSVTMEQQLQQSSSFGSVSAPATFTTALSKPGSTSSISSSTSSNEVIDPRYFALCLSLPLTRSAVAVVVIVVAAVVTARLAV